METKMLQKKKKMTDRKCGSIFQRRKLKDESPNIFSSINCIVIAIRCLRVWSRNGIRSAERKSKAERNLDTKGNN
jgi:hypothetical protein